MPEITLPPLHTDDDVHRAAALCLECAVDRYQYLESVHASDDCSRACVAAVTALLAEPHDPVETSAVLMRCADACDTILAGGRVAEQYAECSRLCWQLASDLTIEAAEGRRSTLVRPTG